MLAPKSFRKSQTGVTLLEVLITMVVVAVGLLGQAALVVQSLKSNNASYLRSQAVLMADDMFERMRLNRAAAVAGCFNLYSGSTLPTGPSGSCNALAISELTSWVTSVEQVLNAQQPIINVDTLGNAYISIILNEVADGSLTGLATSTTFTTMSVI